jgi:hypothetical protein
MQNNRRKDYAMFITRVLKQLALMLVLGLTVPTSVQAGNLWLTGHDADLHCAFGAQCNHFGIAIDFARLAAPNPGLPLLFLDSGTQLATAAGQTAAKNRNSVQGAGNPFLFTVVDPSSAAFSALALTTTAFSGIVIASDNTCGGCDNDAADIAAINARTADITAFFNAGGGLAYMSGAERRATYYNSVPIGATAAAVSPPFDLTPAGVAIGLVDPADTDCCPTHNAFALPGAGSALQVAETDSTGLAETLFARGAAITDGGIVTPPPTDGVTPPPTGKIAEPSTVALLGLALAALGMRRRRR